MNDDDNIYFKDSQISKIYYDEINKNKKINNHIINMDSIDLEDGILKQKKK